MYTLYDVENWNRKHTYEFFLGFDDPYVDGTANIDITPLYDYCKKKGLGFGYATLWVAGKLCNEIENLRLRIVDGELRLYDQVNLGQTLGHPDGSYTHCFLQYYADIDEFCTKAKAHATERLKYPGEHDERSSGMDVIHSSIVRWIHFTSIKNPRMNKQDHIPKLMIGKAEEDFRGRLMMPVSLSVHHALADGYHMGLFYNGYQKIVDSFR